MPLLALAAYLFLPPSLAWPTTAVLVSISAFLGVKIWQVMRQAAVTGPEAMKGKLASVRSWSGHEGQINYHGELWSARGPEAFRSGDWVVITGLEGLKAIVQRATANNRE
ncbi:MAG: hypothetical protein A2Z21_07850 [Candidatus Fraserbacteria bacterium RBG_16_55_9]|uniref:NfeD-like C-terminal domain-containing protein n=1 Tax=Fraserbacteria sp. (strain RBG_16_55_9) TaxID=1817864 RepID=A0A1F5UQB5_FRAXR|nr:MAG: hypothetical protein A2Z21_07850 [Candidatus Fraserbacteria bacterium RBG_16_55_9]